VDFELARAQCGRNLKTDEARPYDNHAARRLGVFDDGLAIRQRAKRTYMPLVGSRDGKPNRFGPGRQQQPVIGNLTAACENDFSGTSIDVGSRLAQARLDMIFEIKALLAQRHVIERSGAGEIVLGKVWPVVRQRIVAAQHDDAALIALPPQHFGRGEAGGSASDDDDLFGRVARSFAARFRLRLFRLPAHPDLAVALLDCPARDRAQRRRFDGLTRAQIETGVMPGTPNRVADHKTVGKWTVIVGAMRCDRENVVSLPYQQDVSSAHVTDKHFAIGKLIKGNALG
jgi:hypothetical protein